MKKSSFFCIFFLCSFNVYAQEKTIKSLPLTLDLKAFNQKGLYQGQKQFYPVLSSEPEYAIYKNNDKDIFRFKGWLRYDEVDNKGSYGDIRELSYTKIFANNIEILGGVSKVFWGKTESVHLADIINQNDEIEPGRSYAKMGQPMISIGQKNSLGNFKYILMPYFRERNFKGKEGRPWLGLNQKNSVYESSQGQRHLDHAVRYNNNFKNFDIAISHFYGTSREPRFDLAFNQDGSLASFTPYYQIINQSALEAQYTNDAILLKAEAIRRQSKDEIFYASVYGIEYSFFDVGAKGYDIGLIAEHVKDNRNMTKSPVTVFQNDIFLGTRLTLNDISGTEMLAGIYNDNNYNTKIYSFEFKRRLNEKLKLEIFANINHAKNSSDFLYFQRRDSNAVIKLTYYFND